MTFSTNDKDTSYLVVEEIKRLLKIEDVLNQYGGLNLKINRRLNGKSYDIKCPFHSDRSPSFSIWPKTETWKCWAGCGSGNVINLVSKFLSISYKEAKLKLQKQLGIKNKWTAVDYNLWQNDRKRLQGFEETKNQIRLELLHYRYLFNQAMKQVVSFEDLDKLVEVYHFKPLIDKYLEEIDSNDFEIQVATVKHLKPLFLEVNI
ncbi:CHC2 zinc finger domain-containing protein [Neobacillus niacini]|uniref:CHC2 zinc finger domain-containing protein n=1 Tax=Neobacillus niacini TaxID=86668 RepID=UPI0005F0BDC1|nr:CHC2 zinc finger domain-containing protein [Neobacillus niacini]